MSTYKYIYVYLYIHRCGGEGAACVSACNVCVHLCECVRACVCEIECECEYECDCVYVFMCVYVPIYIIYLLIFFLTSLEIL